MIKNGNVRYFCTLCGEKFHRSVLTKEHIIPKSRGGMDKGYNLTLSCAPCNNRRKNHTWITPKYCVTSGKLYTPNKIKKIMRSASRKLKPPEETTAIPREGEKS